MADKTGIILKPIERPFHGANANRTVETKKMIAFVCQAGRHFGESPASIAECEKQGHDPYYSTKRIAKTREKVVTKTEVIDGEETEVEVVEGEETYYIKMRQPNWEQVVHDVSSDSGQNVARRVARGWKFPEELGYAPFCDYMGCSAQNPKYITPVGNYHLRDEAALMMLTKGGREDSLEGIAVFIDDDTSRDRRRQQLDEVGARFHPSA